MSEQPIPKKLGAVAREIVRKFTNVETAKAAMLKTVRADKALREECIAYACADAVYDARSSALSGLKYSAPRPGPDAGSTSAIAASIRSSFLDSWTLPDGTVLGDANGATLLELAGMEHQQVIGHTMNAVFYERLGKAVGPRGIVRRKFTHARAVELWENIRAEIGGQSEAV